MLNITLDNLACPHCSFLPFCASEEENSAGPLIKKYRVLKRKELLCLQHNEFHSLYIVRRGVLKSYQTEANGKELVRGFYFAGEMLGYEAIHSHQYPYSAIALSETVVCQIPYSHFLELLHVRPALQKHILHLTSQQLSMGYYLAATVAEQRLAAFLIDLAARLYPAQAPPALLIPMSRHDIGNYLRLTGETISRIFSRLQKAKIITIDNKRIRFLQPEKLQRIADGVV